VPTHRAAQAGSSDRLFQQRAEPPPRQDVQCAWEDRGLGRRASEQSMTAMRRPRGRSRLYPPGRMLVAR
jgi:hypothetical protein